MNLYHQFGSVTKTVQVLGYPTRQALYQWICNEVKPIKQRKALELTNTKFHPRNPPFQVKMDALHRYFELGESIKSVSEDIGYTRSSIYAWRKKYPKKGAIALMNNKIIQPETLEEGSASSKAKVEELKVQMLDMQLEIDILKETINVLKKDPGIDLTALKNPEKAAIVDALKNKYSLPLLFDKLNFAKSCYYYQENAFSKQDKYAKLHNYIRKIFAENKGRYGYRHIYGMLVKECCTVSEKVIRRIMKQENLVVGTRKKKKYSSYKGEITPSVSNVIERNLHADKPDSNWVNTMLDNAIALLKNHEHPIIHSDRGCHYRLSGWIEKMDKSRLTRSMSKKGCSPDNSACEGLF